MVVFTCNHCGESLQKPRVEKHYAIQCRRPKYLTCVDCFKDFKNEEYTVHTKCITEEERCGAKGSIPGGVPKKGKVEQESWIDMIRSIVQAEQNLKPSLKHLFNTISACTNVPRKRAKFLNFVKSSSGGRTNLSAIEAAWNLIEKHKNEQNKSNNIQSEPNVNDKENGTKHKLENNEEVHEKKQNKCNNNIQSQPSINKEKGTKHKLDDSEEVTVKKKKKVEEQPETQEDSDKFSFKETILNIISSKGSISCKKLQKKVLAAYLKETGNTEYTEKTIKKFNKKLQKLPNVIIQNDIVSLVSNLEQ